MKRNKSLFFTCFIIFSSVLLSACGTTLNNKNSAESPEKSQSDKNLSVNVSTGEDADSDNEVLHFQGEGNRWKITFTRFKGPLVATTISEAGSKDSRANDAYIKYIGDGQPRDKLITNLRMITESIWNERSLKRWRA